MTKWLLQFAQKLFLRYAIVGILSAAMEMSLLILFVEHFGIEYLRANTIAFSITTLFNYALNRAWVFERTGQRKRTEFLLFMGFVAVGLLINQVIVKIGVYIYQWDYRIVKIFAIGAVVIWNFFTRKKIVFAKKNS